MRDWNISSRATIRRFFHTGFTAADIAEYLISYDANQPAADVRRRMVNHDFDVVGLRDDAFRILSSKPNAPRLQASSSSAVTPSSKVGPAERSISIVMVRARRT